MTLLNNYRRFAVIKWAFPLLFALHIAPIFAQAKPALLPLTIGIYKINAELADTESKQQRGLMFRTQLPSNHGMLFLFDTKFKLCFWMRNTLIPLSIAFLQDDGTIINIEDMQPQTETSHCATTPVRYALEMNQGWFKEKGIQPGQQIKGLPR